MYIYIYKQHIRNMQPKINIINFQTSGNVHKCLYATEQF